ncbi:SprB repeat-containing protein [Reichenbachiella agariperforans]|uniref:SprB repeat-containing protein n=1 Tax=Reichenbachiella agariperforans TaxID=156994 RepID=A0A1M6VE86_REIAG|nr:SprB repeat-containing protein [Reichenbachiella agariperforans]SHK79645.1 SprB repeat-containing protein [Reichenbachiella agariperforans]
MKLRLLVPVLAVLFSACDKEEEAVDCAVSDLGLAVVSQRAVSCTEAGTVSLLASGGSAPYEYSLDGVSFRETTDFTGLSAGAYTAIVRDDNQCTKMLSLTVASDLPSFEISMTVAQNAGCGGSDGAISVTASGGTGQLTYAWDGVDRGIDPQLTGLANGEHILGVTDAAGCSTEQSVYVPSGISYATSISAIIQNNCAISGCHVAGTGIVDFGQFDNIQEKAADIKSLTQSKTMPRNGEISDEEIAMLACWVDDGALDN